MNILIQDIIFGLSIYHNHSVMMAPLKEEKATIQINTRILREKAQYLPSVNSQRREEIRFFWEMYQPVAYRS